MMTAWRRLDAEADGSARRRSPVRDRGDALRRHGDRHRPRPDEAAWCWPMIERKVYAASEVARLIEAMPTVAAIKEKFPGAKVKPLRFETPDSFGSTGIKCRSDKREKVRGEFLTFCRRKEKEMTLLATQIAIRKSDTCAAP